MNERKQQRLKSLVGIGIVLAIMAIVCVVAWEPIAEAAREPEKFRAWIVAARGGKWFSSAL